MAGQGKANRVTRQVHFPGAPRTRTSTRLSDADAIRTTTDPANDVRRQPKHLRLARLRQRLGAHPEFEWAIVRFQPGVAIGIRAALFPLRRRLQRVAESVRTLATESSVNVKPRHTSSLASLAIDIEVTNCSGIEMARQRLGAHQLVEYCPEPGLLVPSRRVPTTNRALT